MQKIKKQRIDITYMDQFLRIEYSPTNSKPNMKSLIKKRKKINAKIR